MAVSLTKRVHGGWRRPVTGMSDVDGVPLLLSRQVADPHRHGGGSLGRVAGATVDGQVVIADGNGRLSEVDPGSVRVVDSDGPPPWPVSGHGPGQTNPTTGFWHRRGHPIMRIGRTWCWADTGEPHPTFGGTTERPCVLCGMMPTPEGHDACLGTVQGAVSACCGHGVAPGHVQLAGEEAVTLPCLAHPPSGRRRPDATDWSSMPNRSTADWTQAAVTALADDYVRQMQPLEVRLLEEVHPVVAERGHLTRDELIDIASWKSRRTSSLIARNTEADVVDITRTAFAAPDRLRHRVLTLLHGVQVPMASAVLTVWQPDRYTVIDRRAVASLRRLGLWTDHDHWPSYPTYCDLCVDEAARLGVDLRTLDRALWESDRRS